MSFADQALSLATPRSVRANVSLPRRQQAFASPADWRDEFLYFLLVDRFSDGRESERPLLDRTRLREARPSLPNGELWRWDRWAQSGADRWQGGTLQGVQSKLGYLQQLGVTAIWLSPVFRQRAHLDSYHGYGVQNFLDVDPRFGTRRDLVELVAAAHQRGMRVILDIIFNHSGANWVYPAGLEGGRLTPRYTGGRYAFGNWVDGSGAPTAALTADADGVWPLELQDPDDYTRAGSGNLGSGDIDDPNAEHKRTDFITLRDFSLGAPGVLSDLAACYKYWIALTDCDGFRIDTLKHVSLEEARNFCGTVKEFAANLGKRNFALIGELAGGDFTQDRYLDVLERNLDAALDIGEFRLALRDVARGLRHPSRFFEGFDPGNAVMGSHRNLGNRHVSILDDHDHVFGEKIRFSADAASERQVIAGVALQLLTLGIPCMYYGTEQSLGGPELAERQWLPEWKSSDRYLREALFGPRHPRPAGAASGSLDAFDASLPGFGPFGTAGRHCFDERNPVYQRIAALAAVRAGIPALRHGRQYLRPTSIFNGPFAIRGAGELLAWSRILDDEECVCVLNTHGAEARGADVLVDANLNAQGATMSVVASFDEALPIESRAAVRRTADGKAFISVRDVAPSDVIVFSTHAAASSGAVT